MFQLDSHWERVCEISCTAVGYCLFWGRLVGRHVRYVALIVFQVFLNVCTLPATVCKSSIYDACSVLAHNRCLTLMTERHSLWRMQTCLRKIDIWDHFCLWWLQSCKIVPSSQARCEILVVHSLTRTRVALFTCHSENLKYLKITFARLM